MSDAKEIAFVGGPLHGQVRTFEYGAPFEVYVQMWDAAPLGFAKYQRSRPLNDAGAFVYFLNAPDGLDYDALCGWYREWERRP